MCYNFCFAKLYLQYIKELPNTNRKSSSDFTENLGFFTTNPRFEIIIYLGVCKTRSYVIDNP